VSSLLQPTRTRRTKRTTVDKARALMRTRITDVLGSRA
jgi:hypothetical protein